MTRRRVVVAALATLGAAVFALGGTGLVLAGRTGSGRGSGSTSAGSSAYGEQEPADAVAVAPAAGATGAADNGATGTTGAAGNGADGNGVAAEREIVRTASLTVTADDPSAAGDRAVAIADAAGGRVDSDVRDGGATLTLRVPADRLDATLSQLAALGVETAREVHGDDVTAQTADIGARVEALTTSVARLRTLIATSGSLADLLAVETQLTARQAELESLQAQQRALADQVSLASVTVTLVAPTAVAAAATGPTGFLGALAGGWHGFTVAVRFVLAAVGYSLPFLVLAAVAIAAALLVRRRRAARHHGADPIDLATG